MTEKNNNCWWLLEKIISGLPGVAVIIDNSGVVVGVNESVKPALGYERKEILGKKLGDLPFLTSESKVVVLDHFQRRMAGEKMEPYTLDFIDKKGNYVKGLVYANKIENSNLGINIDLVVIRVLSDANQKQDNQEFGDIQKALKTSEERYKFLVNSTNEYILIVSLTGKILFANQATINGFGFSEEEVVGKPITTFLYPQSAVKVAKALVAAFAGKSPPKFDIYTKTKDGGYRIVENNSKSVAFINTTDTKGMLIFGRDVTEQRKFEAEIKKSEDRFQAIFRYTKIAYLIFNEKKEIIDANPSAIELVGINVDGMKGKNIAQIEMFAGKPAEEINKNIDIALGGNQQIFIEFTGKSGNGKEIQLEADIYKLLFENKSAVIVGIRDVSDKKRFETQMLEKNQELESFNKLMVGRELKMAELKEEIAQLKNKYGVN